WARYDSAAAKVGGNQGRMAGRRAVGFLQIVSGVFPAGVMADRLRERSGRKKTINRLIRQ
ncbi:MAG TPA: hypothetical protein PLE35_07165, partial [Lentisphaeria bacterium]|nr:hypothetical protein [Lentisphaeria bacterium]